MCVNNLPKVAAQWNSGATGDSNRGCRVLILILMIIPKCANNYTTEPHIKDYNKTMSTNNKNIKTMHVHCGIPHLSAVVILNACILLVSSSSESSTHFAFDDLTQLNDSL